MMILVTGGASSGKSAFAETLACALPGPRYYLAAMKPFGEEGARRIARHRALRAGKGFRTIECYDGLLRIGESIAEAKASLPGQENGSQSLRGTALLESLGNVVANELFADDGTVVAADVALQAVVGGVGHVGSQFDSLVIVGDEVGGDGLRYDKTTEDYICVIGSAACALAQRCDVVVECVAGQPLAVKGASVLEKLLPKEVACA